MHQPDPTFPPLLSGKPVKGAPGPFGEACAEAARGTAGAGDVFWGRTTSELKLAIVLEPEVEAARSLQMVFALMVAFGDAFGAIGPPEVGVFYRWPLGFMLNAAEIGGARAALPAGAAPGDVPDRLVVGLDVKMRRGDHDEEPGHDLARTTLEDEGCGDITRTELIESLCRHFLVWVHTWNDDGFKPVHDAWMARAEGREEEVTLKFGGAEHHGHFLGIDEEGNMLLKTGDGGATSALPLISAVERFDEAGVKE